MEHDNLMAGPPATYLPENPEADAMLALARSGARIELPEISGNNHILLTGVAPRTWRYQGGRGTMLYALPLPTDASRKRVAMRVPTRDLIELLREIRPATDGLVVDHIYDY